MTTRTVKGVPYLLTTFLVHLIAACAQPSDQRPMTTADGSDGAVPLVRVAFGWRAREVERQSTARLTFPDQDESTAILEGAPAALAYVEGAHAVTLPPGRFLAVEQLAGRVYRATATPQSDALAPDAATQLGEALAARLDAAGWARVSGAGLGVDQAVAQAVQSATNTRGGFGVAHVGTWRTPRPAASWAVVPPNGPARVREWDGVEAVVTVRPLRSRGVPRLLFQVQMSDALLELSLQAQVSTRRDRSGGDAQTLRSWDTTSYEPLRSHTP